MKNKGKVIISVDEIRKGYDQSLINFFKEVDKNLEKDKQELLIRSHQLGKNKLIIKWKIVKSRKKKFQVLWYQGTPDGEEVKCIFDIREMKANDISLVKWQKIMPRKLRSICKDYKVLDFDKEEVIVIDYGDKTRFIRIWKD